MKLPLKRIGKWIGKWIWRKAESDLIKKIVPMQDIGIPRTKKRGQ